jgi:putative peptide zinc metalloprotease protein
VVLQHDSPLAPVAFQFALVAFVNNSLQLLPLLELDGYYALVDWLELPLLRPRALAFVRDDLWRKLRTRAPFSREERIFAVYGVLALAYSGFALWAAGYLWERRLQRLVADAWAHESAGWRGLAVVVVIAFGAPLVFALVLKLRQLLQQGRQAVARLRHRGAGARAQARLDARALVGRLRFLGELSFPERETVVRQLRLARFRPGTYVVRQGASNERFYLIRQGQAEVLRAEGAGAPRELAVLRRGDYFGELGMLHHRPAAASVRALTPLQVYALERDAFEATIAPRLRDYGVTAQWIEARAELARMPLFRHTGAAELDAILERLQVSEHPAGAVIIRQADPHDRFYLIRRGRVRVSVSGREGQEGVLAELGPGMSFGEGALLGERPCPATVRALERVVLWSLDRGSFEDLLLRQLHLAGALSAASEQRAAACRHLVGAPTASYRRPSASGRYH